MENRYLALRTIAIVGLKRLLLHMPTPVSNRTNVSRCYQTVTEPFSGDVSAHHECIQGPFTYCGPTYAVSGL